MSPLYEKTMSFPSGEIEQWRSHRGASAALAISEIKNEINKANFFILLFFKSYDCKIMKKIMNNKPYMTKK